MTLINTIARQGARFRTTALILTTFGTMVLPNVASAESTKMLWHDGVVQLGPQSQATPILIDSSSSSTTQVTYAKVIVNNANSTSTRVECELMNFNRSADLADVTLAPGAFATLSMSVATPSGANSLRLCCWVVNAVSGATAQWAKMTIRYGAPTVSAVSQ